MPVVSTGEITIIDVNDGIAIVLSKYSHILVADEAGTVPAGSFTDCKTTITIINGGKDDTSNWSISAVSSVGLTGSLTSNVYSVTALSAAVGGVTFTASRTGFPNLVCDFSVEKIKNPNGGIAVILSNENHTFATDNAGVVGSYTGSGTTVQVYEGAFQFNAVSSISAAGQFTVGTPVITTGTITAGARSYSGVTATVANHSGMNTDQVVITYPISIRRRGATGNITINKVQTLTKSKKGDVGGPGDTGQRGPGFFGAIYSYIATTTEEITSRFTALTGFVPVVGDIFVQTLDTGLSSSGKKFNGSSWVDPGIMLHGDLIATGTIGASKIAVGAINANHIAAGAITTGKLDANAVTADKIDVSDLYAQHANISGSLTVGSDVRFVKLGGDQLINAVGHAGTAFMISDTSGLIEGSYLKPGSLQKDAFNQPLVDWLRGQFAASTPTSGGIKSASALISNTTITLESLTTVSNKSVALTTAFVGDSFDAPNASTPNLPTITIQNRRTVGGTTINIGSPQTYVGTARKGEPYGGGLYIYTYTLPTINLSLNDPSPVNGTPVYSLVITIANFPGNYTSTLNFKAEQETSGTGAGGSTGGAADWFYITNKPTTAAGWLTDVSLIGHIHSAADITSGTLPTVRGGTGRTDGKVAALATPRAINGTNFDGSAAITTANWGTARTLTIGNTGKSVNGSANVSWSLEEIGAQASLGFTPVQQGGGAGQSSNKLYIGWTGSNLNLQVDSTNFGSNWPIAVTGAAGSISGFNNPTAAATANTTAYRDGSADISARLFRSNFIDQVTLSGAMAFRVNNSSDDYIRFCSNTAAIRTWMGADNASNLTQGTISDARLPGTFSKKQISGAVLATGANDYHFELFSPDSGSSGGDIALRFHHGNRWYHSIRANAKGFRFTSGGSNNLERLTAGAYYFGDNGGNMGAGAGSSMRVQTPTGYVDIGSTNTDYAHFSTDRPAYYFNKSIQVNGEFQIYNTGSGLNSSGLFWDSGATTLYKLATGAISIGTTNTGAVNKMLHFGYTPTDGYGFRFLHQGHASNVGAGTFSLQRGLVNSWGTVLSVDNAGNVNLHNNQLRLRSVDDANHYLGYVNVAVGGRVVDGPELVGNLGGRLGTANGNTALYWGNDKRVYINEWLEFTSVGNVGLYWPNKSSQFSCSEGGRFDFQGGGSDCALTLKTSDGVDRGVIYTTPGNVGFLLPGVSGWALRVDSAGMLHVADGTSTSDRRVKRNIQPIQDALAKVKKLTGNTYDQIEMGIRRAGPIAQEVEVVLPEAVSADENGKLAVSQMGLIALLIEAVKDLSTEVDTLKRRLH